MKKKTILFMVIILLISGFYSYFYLGGILEDAMYELNYARGYRFVAIPVFNISSGFFAMVLFMKYYVKWEFGRIKNRVCMSLGVMVILVYFGVVFLHFFNIFSVGLIIIQNPIAMLISGALIGLSFFEREHYSETRK